METSEKQIHWCFYIHPHSTSIYISDFCLVIWAKLTLPLWLLTMLIPRGLCCMLLWRWSMELWPADIVTLLSWAVRRGNRIVVRLKKVRWNVRLKRYRMQCSYSQEEEQQKSLFLSKRQKLRLMWPSLTTDLCYVYEFISFFGTIVCPWKS